MKKSIIIYCVLLAMTIFFIGCSGNSIQNTEDSTMRLNIIEFSDKGIISTDNKNGKYDIPNSDFKIVDNNDNSLSWNNLKNAKIIDVHYSGMILERNPATFEKINKIKIIS